MPMESVAFKVAFPVNEQMRPEHSLNPRAPIYRLNHDILSLIFEFARDEHPVPKLHFIFCVLQVSRLWRRVALDTPRLWSRIIDVLHPRLIRTHIAYSKCAPLDISFKEGRRQQVQSSISLLMPHVSRWQRFSLTGWADDLSLTAPAPHLEELYLDSMRDDKFGFPSHDVFSGSTPRLRSLVLRRFLIPLTSGIYVNLVSLRLEELHCLSRRHPDCWAQFFRILGACPLLEALQIKNVIFDQSTHTYDQLRLREPIHLPHLHDIQFYIQGTTTAYSILQSREIRAILASIRPSPSSTFCGAFARGDPSNLLPELAKTLESHLHIEQLSLDFGYNDCQIMGRGGGCNRLNGQQEMSSLEIEYHRGDVARGMRDVAQDMHFPNLTCLSVTGRHFALDSHVSEFIELLRSMPGIRDLRMTYVEMIYVDALRDRTLCPLLEELALTEVEIEGETLVDLMRLRSAGGVCQAGIKVLYIKDCWHGDMDEEALATLKDIIADVHVE
ncbi:hypothetical protein BOTBODRAFT_71082 [Botryobasidium botryosum FD-172 SS1]|uniref:Uncharacterized protein n=1 Tax=Botryobasidium botryosum (strain FD-172 SS1) TaxID=930990 RepID=A0A067M3N0_BOTB1|nr:hypothetical protein BOTBODRAFT_71082 [Botryobasidium botryosum FD-172 SS1]